MTEKPQPPPHYGITFLGFVVAGIIGGFVALFLVGYLRLPHAAAADPVASPDPPSMTVMYVSSTAACPVIALRSDDDVDGNWSVARADRRHKPNKGARITGDLGGFGKRTVLDNGSGAQIPLVVEYHPQNEQDAMGEIQKLCPGATAD